ncbi:Uncharacterised protein [[Actinobacillus] rossii]|uniref:Uncharacterized protein n=1 Tax=[Actinobacillus] rossii TaxID=123820 RepID=A0A380TWS9_9PAST|nr:Uncharacterised protein [[Actinobacillus] rossii]
MAEFGIVSTDERGRKIDLSKRTAMIMDILLIPYNSNGSKTYSYNVGSVMCTNNDIAYQSGHKGKVINFSINGKTLTWNWVDFDHIKSTAQTVLVFAGV